MDGLPILDYAPGTLLGIGVLLVFFGRLVPYTTVKQLLEEIKYLRSTNAKQAEALEEAQATNKIVRLVFEELGRGAGE